MRKRFPLLLLAGALLVLCAALLGFRALSFWKRSTGITITVHNRSGHTLQQVFAGSPEASNRRASFGTVKDGQSLTRRVDAEWEGSTELSFIGANSRPVQHSEGYVTAPGGFTVEFTIRPGNKVDARTDLNQ